MPYRPCLFAALLLALAGLPAFGGGVAIVSATLTDNGDDDGHADTRETVTMRLTVKNTSPTDLTDLNVGISTSDPTLVCISEPAIQVGPLAAGETKLTDEGFTFTVMDVDRVTLGIGAHDQLVAHFTFEVLSEPTPVPAQPSRYALDLDLDVSGGGEPSGYLESFEGSLGTFEVQNLDAGKSSLAGSDGYRCTYSDPDVPGSNTYGHELAETCHMSTGAVHAAQEWWGLSGRAFSGFQSLYFGEELGDPLGFTTPLATLEAAGTFDPIDLGWDGVSPTLTFKHQAFLVDWQTAFWPLFGTTYDRGIVMAQAVDDQGNGVGPWVKLDPWQNTYDQRHYPQVINCAFDPVDDGTTEDDYFDPDDPDPPLGPEDHHGPSSTCYPETIYAFIGDTEQFDPESVGNSDGPGLQGTWGIGTWIESKVDLSRFRGRRVRLRFLASTQKITNEADTWEEQFSHNPNPGDNGWWIDDVSVDGVIDAPATVAVDAAPNAGLPVPPDSDLDSVCDLVDNCTALGNPGQKDKDADSLGDACDPCPTDPTNFDPDEDAVCAAADNCPFDANPAQANADADPAGDACDCAPADPVVYPGATEANDGVDNNCPGDPGAGLVDELTEPILFDAAEVLVWPPQTGAARYQVARAASPEFAGCSATGQLGQPSYTDPDPVLPDEIRYYLVRPSLPNVGSWGADSLGLERSLPCS